MKKLIKESGLRDIKALAKRYPKAKIYFHQDLDGVTTAIAMKKYLEDNGINVVDSEIIQYGDKEFSVKKLDANGDTMPVLVDFAHGKPMFVIHTDHHDRQVGTGDTSSTSFKSSRSNVETISQVVSPKEIFPETDLRLISTVDSADYAKYDITPEQVMNYMFKLDKNKSLLQNKFAMGLVLNKLILAFKNKPGFMENLVINAEPSLYSILMQVKKEMSERRLDFLVIAWPLGLLQASCNPFKKERELKGVNLGDIAQEVLGKHENQLKSRMVPLSTIKYISEGSIGPESVGFTFKDFEALYGEKFNGMENGDEYLKIIEKLMDKPTKDLTDKEFEVLDKFGVSAWDLIQANSGGHKCITNISGINYLGRSNRPPSGQYKYDPEKSGAAYINVLKKLQNEFVSKLQEKINESK